MPEQFKFQPQRQHENEREGETDEQIGVPEHETVEQVRAEVHRLGQKVDQIADALAAILKTREQSLGKAIRAGKIHRPVTKEGNSQQVPPGRRRRQQGDGDDDDFNRVAKMLEDIEKLLGLLVNSKFPVPPEIRESVLKSWPTASAGLQKARGELQSKMPSPKYRRLLINAGFTGDMLDLKERSLRVQKSQIEKAVLTYDQKESFGEKVARWIKPGFKVMNSILGSLSGIPGVEIAKEFKDHLESGYELVEVGQPE